MSDSVLLPLFRQVQKSVIDETSLPQSVMNRQQADRFIDLVVQQNVLLRNIRTRRVNHSKGSINKLDLGSIATEGAATTSTPTTRFPDERVVNYDTVKFRCCFDITSDFDEDNIERTGARNTLVNMFTKRMSNDVELAAIEGDEALPVGDGESDRNNLLGVNDGFLKILEARVPSSRVVDAAGKNVSDALFYAMKRKINNRYRSLRNDYVYIVSPGVADKWHYDMSLRQTVLGDRMITANNPGDLTPGHSGMPMLVVPQMPENLTFTGSGGGSTGTEILLTPRENLIAFIQRDITVESQRVPRRDLSEFTIHFRFDVNVENEDLVVRAENVNVEGEDYTL